MMAENYMLKETLSYPSLIREVIAPLRAQAQSCLLYTSDAADD